MSDNYLPNRNVFDGLSRAESIAILRANAEEAYYNTPLRDYLDNLADYLEATADDMGREAMMEIAMAYLTGSGRNAPKGAWQALDAAELRR